MRKTFLAATGVALVLTLGGCSEEERRAARESQERIAAQQAYQQRLAQQYAAELAAETQRLHNKLAAETQRLKNIEAAETERRLHEHITVLGKIISVLMMIVGLVGLITHAILRLGKKHTEERTKRHVENLRAIIADKNLSSAHRAQLYGAAIEAANKGDTPLLTGPDAQGGAA
ncbi:MAG: hypothetical protein RIB45_06050 [Marivibrio sp.]|uniref:hypothetical protein n=1 Tax=Marivibrio sp. TaxID=2039719 RepID=UPI0032EEC0C8